MRAIQTAAVPLGPHGGTVSERWCAMKPLGVFFRLAGCSANDSPNGPCLNATTFVTAASSIGTRSISSATRPPKRRGARFPSRPPARGGHVSWLRMGLLAPARALPCLRVHRRGKLHRGRGVRVPREAGASPAAHCGHFGRRCAVRPTRLVWRRTAAAPSRSPSRSRNGSTRPTRSET